MFPKLKLVKIGADGLGCQKIKKNNVDWYWLSEISVSS